MHPITNAVRKLRIRKDTLGQDLIEYALLAGLLAFGACVVIPSATDSLNAVYGRVTSVLIVVAQGGDPVGSAQH